MKKNIILSLVLGINLVTQIVKSQESQTPLFVDTVYKNETGCVVTETKTRVAKIFRIESRNDSNAFIHTSFRDDLSQGSFRYCDDKFMKIEKLESQSEPQSEFVNKSVIQLSCPRHDNTDAFTSGIARVTYQNELLNEIEILGEKRSWGFWGSDIQVNNCKNLVRQ